VFRYDVDTGWIHRQCLPERSLDLPHERGNSLITIYRPNDLSDPDSRLSQRLALRLLNHTAMLKELSHFLSLQVVTQVKQKCVSSLKTGDEQKEK